MLRRALTPTALSRIARNSSLQRIFVAHNGLPASAASALSVAWKSSSTTATATAAADDDTTEQRPFDKVLIANRGEIAGRVIRTCRKYGIKTVAIHSTADRPAPFVQMADERVCIGPPASSESYLNVDRVLEAIAKTGAQAVHPGYGFLSENASFAESIQGAGVAWLGPPVSAIQDMGDKLRSKEIAQNAGVSIIPGYDGTLDSVEHALQVMHTHNITFPILIKAAAGGGGKGMRVCYNEQDVKEAFPMAKSEAKKFFKDDRLLLEKFVENPHHIEFQVLAGPKKNGKPGELDVLVFPERECSIQRRNQKVIEESPSCLLTDETRIAMATQVKMLVNQVGYTSAGTVEWLVDEHQNFYFLEMNTRLQVEHPITEAITGFDLVKGMLWIGAGWGIPQDMLDRVGDNVIVPHCGHAVEARVYAEDPLRGFLPSTGPLVPYVEPTELDDPIDKTAPDAYKRLLRIDSGVAQGHVVTPFYDPMLSKVIVHAGTRADAVEGLAQALDHYIIEGVQHNARLVNAVLRHDAFKAGHTPTSFLKRHFPDGFQGVQLKPTEKEELAVAVAAIGAGRQALLQQPPLTGVNGTKGTVVVKLGGLFGEAYAVTLSDDKTSALVKKLPSADDGGVEATPPEARSVVFDKPIEYDPSAYLARCSLDGKSRAIQVVDEKTTGELKVQMYGADMPVLIQSWREYELSKHMHVPIIPDTSSMVLSPMPGALISFAVKPGDTVQIGQELCIVEAMKMQNIIRSPRTGQIANLLVKVGQSLAADQVILDFVPDSADK